MKKIRNYYGGILLRFLSKKTIRVMKITLFLSMFTIIQLWATESYSQFTKLTLKLEDVKISDALKEIENQSEFFFLYSPKLIDVERKVNIDAEDETIKDILSNLFEKKVNFAVYDRQVVLTPNEKSEILSAFQQKQITGTVTDKNGPIPGVNVVVTGTTQGTITEIDGKYSIEVPQGAKSLTFSFIGMQPQEISIGTLTQINVDLVAMETALDEVIVIGYGTQKKVNVLGSISSVKPEELTMIPMPNIAQSLMGKTSGLFIKNGNGQPGDESGVSFNIRGFGDPLIIIDGATVTSSDFQKLDPNQIENISILKDAAAASVYGARAGNGVVLVKTKRGLISAPKVTFSNNIEFQYFLAVPQWCSSEQTARIENLARYNIGLSPMWTDEQIQIFHDGSDPNKYPNNDWWGYTVRKFAPQLQHNLSVQGGTEKVKYFISGGYFYQEAMLKANETKNKRYNLRSNIDISLTKKLSMNLDISLLYEDYYSPSIEMERKANEKHGLMTYLFRIYPYDNYTYPDPTKINFPNSPGDGNPFILSQSKYVGYIKNNALKGDAKVGFSYDLPFGIQAKANFRFYDSNKLNKKVIRRTPFYQYNWDTDIYTFKQYSEPGYSSVYQYTTKSINFDQQFFLNWDKKIKNSNISAMVAFETLSDNNEWFDASRRDYEFAIDYLYAGPSLNQNNSGTATEGGRVGLISRINYDYKGKYLVELNSRYDASAKFPKETRWGFFPSASVGWRISEEDFIKDKLSFLTNLKIRASLGKLGYDNTGNFQFLETYSINGKLLYDGTTLVNGIKSDALVNNSITWEKMTTKNVGLDFNLWNSKLEGSFDYFYRLRSDVLGTRIKSMPNVVGATLPQINYAKYDNRGWEFGINHRNQIFGIDYSLGGNISWTREKVVDIDQNVFANQEAFRTGNQVGEWADRFWGYMDDGLFQTQEEINNWADIDGKNNASIILGDIKYKDYNGDGKITGEDQVIIGRGSFPKLMYGLNMTLGWKGISFNMLWQGAGLYDINLRNSSELYQPFCCINSPSTVMLNDSYVPEGNKWLPANTNAQYPRYRYDGSSTPNFNKNTQLWLSNGAYIRLKNIELGYTLPTGLTKKWGLDKARFSLAAYNLLTFSANKYIDPEIDTSPENQFGDYYPLVGTYSMGLMLEF